jgi:trehalose-6-phosphate synthase
MFTVDDPTLNAILAAWQASHPVPPYKQSAVNAGIDRILNMYNHRRGRQYLQRTYPNIEIPDFDTWIKQITKEQTNANAQTSSR